MVVHPSRILIGHDPVAEAAAWRNERPGEDDPPSGDLPQTQPQRPKCDGPKGANSANPTFNSRSNPREIKDLGVCVTDYGYRYLHPELGRWISRDPIGEEGGLNLYGFVNNNSPCNWDLIGLFLTSCSKPDPCAFAQSDYNFLMDSVDKCNEIRRKIAIDKLKIQNQAIKGEIPVKDIPGKLRDLTDRYDASPDCAGLLTKALTLSKDCPKVVRREVAEWPLLDAEYKQLSKEQDSLGGWRKFGKENVDPRELQKLKKK